MTQSSKHCSWQLSLINALGITGALTIGLGLFPVASPLTNYAFAQSKIIPDNTLGDESSRVEPNNPDDSTELLTGGATRGNNLFHSFLEFNVSEGRTARFSPDGNIQNLFVRVTGSDRSEILGRIQVSGSDANLFLINPRGVFFGSGATLELNGSFLSSTASAIKFTDATFSATAPRTTPLLSVNVPIGLQFGRTAGKIDVQGFLGVNPGKTLALVGGNLNLDNSEGYGYLQAESGQIALGGILGQGTIGINLDSKTQPLSFPKNVELADISLNNTFGIDANGSGGGYIQLQGKHITFADGSLVFAETTGEQNGRGIFIQAEQLTIKDGSQLSTSTTDIGTGGNLDVRVADSVRVIGTDKSGNPSALFADAFGKGAAGNLTIQTGRLIVENGGNISAATGKESEGIGGTLKVVASDFILLNGISELTGRSSGLFAQTGGSGNAGSLIIDTRQLIIENEAQVTAGTLDDSQGNGGTLSVYASEFVKLSGTASGGRDTSGLFVRSRGNGNAGSLFITTGQLIVDDQAQVTVSALGNANAGNLYITANEIRLDNQAKLLATTTSGNGGDIQLQLQNLLSLRRNSQISTTAGTAGKNGNGGNITINIPNGFIVAVPGENSDISANAFTGKGGNIDINAFRLIGTQYREKPSNFSDITASSEFGLDGKVEIITPDIDPNQRVINVPTQTTQPKLAQGCQAVAGRNPSSFIITGRGGVPANPTEPLKSDAVLADWITLDTVSKTYSNQSVGRVSIQSSPETIVEATGWVVNAKGEVVLTANVPGDTVHGLWQKSNNCNVRVAE
ncbi:MAG: filamentous hemagglutinin N-terminal domain-containing protein [Desmonostoc vinosum HA7617-LM4]|jgi:filamentous hemagglutinin family protein|nr:filamentous hemagglutinin N-terminal domain-containing protein [Desmonostoc vinosum HA7617-LM4]